MTKVYVAKKLKKYGKFLGPQPEPKKPKGINPYFSSLKYKKPAAEGKILLHTDKGSFELSHTGKPRRQVAGHVNIADNLEKSDLLNMYKPEQHEIAKPFIDWTKNLPNKDWRVWAVRNHRSNPEAFTDDVKGHLEHFSSMTHVPEIANIRFDKTHSFEDGIAKLKGAEQTHIDRVQQTTNFAEMPNTAKKVVDLGGGKAWWSLGKPSCRSEGGAMGHCGNTADAAEFHDILSLRTEHNLGGKKYYEPHLTFINDTRDNLLGEMKGRGNKKPAKHYHDDIVKLLEQGYTTIGGGYLPHSNFHPDDLEEHHVNYLAEKNPHALLGHSTKTKELAHHYIEHPNPSVRSNLTKLSDLSEDVLHRLATDEEPFVRANLAQNQTKMSPHLVEKLATDTDWIVRHSLAESDHPLSTELIDRMLDDPSPEVRTAIANTRHLLPESSEKAALTAAKSGSGRRLDQDLLLGIAAQPQLTEKTIDILVGSNDHYVSRQLLRSHPDLSHNTIRNIRKQHRDYNFDEQIAETQRDIPMDIIEDMTKTPRDQPVFDRLMASLAGKQNKLPESLINSFATHQAASVRKALATRPDLPKEIVHQLANDSSPYVQISIVENQKNLPLDIVHSLANSEYADIQNEVMNKYQLPPEMLHKLIQRGSSKVNETIAWTQNKLHPDTVKELASAPEVFTRIGVARNPSLTPEAMNILIQSNHTDILENLIDRRDISEDVLNQLASHRDSIVRSAAKDRLYEIQEQRKEPSWVNKSQQYFTTLLKKSQIKQQVKQQMTPKVKQDDHIVSVSDPGKTVDFNPKLHNFVVSVKNKKNRTIGRIYVANREKSLSFHNTDIHPNYTFNSKKIRQKMIDKAKEVSGKKNQPLK